MNYNYKAPPLKHQKRVIEKIIEEDRNYFALFHDMGTGKTFTTINLYRLLCNRNKKVLKALIICPIAVMDNWLAEFEKFSNVPLDIIQVVDGTTKPNGKKLKTPSLKLKKQQLEDPEKKIFILNPENVGNKNLWPLVCKLGIDFLAIDESHKFKGYNSVRTKALHKFLTPLSPKYRFIATGSPILQNALDLWAQYYVLNPNILGENFFSFRAEYFYDKNYGMPSDKHFPNWQPRPDSYERLNKIIYQHADRVMKSEVLDLPPLTSEVRRVKLHNEAKRMYNEMLNSLVAFLEDPYELDLQAMLENGELDMLPSTMKVDLALVKSLRLMQLCNGVFTPDDGEVIDVPCNKYLELESIIEEITNNPENKAIVWTTLTPTYERISAICEKLGVKFTYLTGLQSKDEKTENINEFNNGEAQIIIANQAAGGTGVNLTAANYAVYFSYDFKLESALQSEARNYRKGQTRNVHQIFLVAEDSIEERILEALDAKKKTAEDILSTKNNFTRKEILQAAIK